MRCGLRQTKITTMTDDNNDPETFQHVLDRQSTWVSYMLWDQGYVSGEKAAELCDMSFSEFRSVLRLLGEGPDHYESGGVLWCDETLEHFEFASEDPLEAPDECPHCEAAL